VIEVKVVGAATPRAPTTVSLPDLEFDRRRDDPSLLKFFSGAGSVLGGCGIDFEPELEHLASSAMLLPGIDKAERAIEDPDALSHLLVHADELSLTVLAAPCSLIEEAVLG
jgi:hypothetical protein